jgi:pre-mRNA-splicing factor ISY1
MPVSSTVTAAGVSEHEVREINDQINKVFKDKRAWELRIKELGGKVVNQVGLIPDEGVEIPGVRGYRYQPA